MRLKFVDENANKVSPKKIKMNAKHAIQKGYWSADLMVYTEYTMMIL